MAMPDLGSNLLGLSLLSAMITPAVLICVLLIRETRLAVRSVDSEMEFTIAAAAARPW